MGLFDKFRSIRSSAEAASGNKKGGQQEALRLINEGNAEEDAGRIEAAMHCYDAAVRLSPDLARGHLNRGNILLETGRLTEALAAYDAALSHDPGYAPAHFNIGNTYFRLGRTGDALSSYEQATRLQPTLIDAEVAKGRAFEELGQLVDAMASYHRVLVSRPDYAEVHSNLGNVLMDLGRYDEAVKQYRHALELNPRYAEAHSNLGNALKEYGRLDDAISSYRSALEIDANNSDALSNLLFVHNYLANQSASQLITEARRYGDLVARQARSSIAWSNDPDPGRRLKVGLVSGDLREHPVGYFAEGVLCALTRASHSVSLIAYSSNHRADALTQRIMACCDGWRAVTGLSDAALVQLIQDDGIDILLDLSGHTAHTRLPVFAWKPAPVQASWLGYFATTGVDAMDYFIADPWTLPESDEIQFTEKIWRLPETRLCFTPPVENVSVAPLPALANGYITFGCFNHLTKMNDQVVALWAQILNAVHGSRLSLKARQITDRSIRQDIEDRFNAFGIGAGQLILEGPASRAAYLESYHRIDIALDPFPYPGGTTTVEALWMGVPVLTLAGNTFLSRQGVGILANAGLLDWIAVDADNYVNRAVSHARDIRSLAILRDELREKLRVSPIFDAPRFAGHFESALRGMWEKWCDQQL